MKGSYYDGGHRVPLFLRWPNGGLDGGRDVSEMALHVDLLPTFIDLCGLRQPDGLTFDGVSLAPLLRGEQERLPGDRTTFVQYRQSTEAPEKWANAVLTRRWRLVYGKELYDIEADPGQREDVAGSHPEVVEHLRQAHADWWAEVAPRLDDYAPISLGSDAENPTTLSAMDVLGDVAWSQAMVVMAQKSTGIWMVKVERAGNYRFSLRRWPVELEVPIDQPLDDEPAGRIAPYQAVSRCGTLHPELALLKIAGREETVSVLPGATEAVFEMHLEATGAIPMEAWFVDADGELCGAYYVTVERR
jgi:hypothetical protein